MRQPFDTDAYRYPNEHLILAVTIFLVLVVIAVTATATLCGSAIFVIVMVALAVWLSGSKHSQLISRAKQLTDHNLPGLDAVVRDGIARLRPGPAQAFVVPADVINAYTFGLSSPKVIVIYSGLLKVMDADEVRFIVGHELGHVRLGHTWLNSLVGGMAGIPSPFAAAVILHLAFRWWNRACEFSADRAGLLACGNPRKAISALVKLTTGGRYTQTDHERAVKPLSAEDELVENFGELLSTHPGVKRRIEELQRYSASPEYRRLQELVSQNSIA
jgi:Zn-dependent protease with chaperone function